VEIIECARAHSIRASDIRVASLGTPSPAPAQDLHLRAEIAHAGGITAFRENRRNVRETAEAPRLHMDTAGSMW
jgi:hypothetical protein